MEQKEIGLAPVVSWEVGPIGAMHAVIFRLDYLTHATQQPSEAQSTPTMVLTSAMALEMSEALKKHAALAKGGTLGDGLPKH